MARYCDEEGPANDFSHHANSCPILARRWDGVGPIPMQLFKTAGASNDPAVLPSARARERLQEWIQEKIAVTREFYK